MKHTKFIIEDSSFLIALMNPNDSLHRYALNTYQSIINFDVTYIYPEMVIYETIFTLIKVGINPDLIRDKINKLSMIKKVIIHHNDILSILRFSSHRYNKLINSNGTTNFTKTNDFIIACSGIDFCAPVISGDKKMLKVMKAHDIECIDFTNETDLINLVKYLE